MKSKKRHIKRGIALSAKKQDVYYKPFVRCCIILLAGILIPQYFQIYYLEYTFLYMVVIPICILSGLYFKFIKNSQKDLCTYRYGRRFAQHDINMFLTVSN